MNKNVFRIIGLQVEKDILNMYNEEYEEPIKPIFKPKPCPICNSNAEFSTTHTGGKECFPIYHIQCQNKECGIHIFSYYENGPVEQKLLDRWKNLRKKGKRKK